MLPVEIWLRLMAVDGVYGDNCLKIAHFLMHCSHVDMASLAMAGLTPRNITQFINFTPLQLETTLRWLALPSHHLLTADSPDYPEQLRAISCFPGALLVEGDIHLLNKNQLAVVGSRNLTDYGERWCRLFCESLAKTGLIITSGLALGIDGIAHRSALQVKGKTIAVLGNGLGSIYPKRHHSLAR